MSKNISEIGLISEFVNVKNIIGNILYTKDDYITCFIRITPILISIMTDYEKWSLADQLTLAFAREKEIFSVLKLDKPINIKNITNSYKNIINTLELNNKENEKKPK